LNKISREKGSENLEWSRDKISLKGGRSNAIKESRSRTLRSGGLGEGLVGGRKAHKTRKGSHKPQRKERGQSQGDDRLRLISEGGKLERPCVVVQYGEKKRGHF